jgi:pimeloyl-ACP methyl ester carboxylesterase
MERLASRFHVLAPDGYGAGKSPAWPEDRTVSLRDETDLLGPVLARAAEPYSLVAHSYGAAVAFIAALRQPAAVKALAVYEPTLFGLLEEEAPGRPAADGIRRAAADAAAAIAAGDPSAAAERFIDYWMGDGSWAAMPTARQAIVAASMSNISGWAKACFGEPTRLQAFRSLDVPVLYMVGGRSPPSTLEVARLLTGVLPNFSRVEFPELGHMAPVTHPEPVNQAIGRFLEQHS